MYRASRIPPKPKVFRMFSLGSFDVDDVILAFGLNKNIHSLPMTN